MSAGLTNSSGQPPDYPWNYSSIPRLITLGTVQCVQKLSDVDMSAVKVIPGGTGEISDGQLSTTVTVISPLIAPYAEALGMIFLKNKTAQLSLGWVFSKSGASTAQSIGNYSKYFEIEDGKTKWNWSVLFKKEAPEFKGGIASVSYAE